MPRTLLCHLKYGDTIWLHTLRMLLRFPDRKQKLLKNHKPLRKIAIALNIEKKLSMSKKKTQSETKVVVKRDHAEPTVHSNSNYVFQAIYLKIKNELWTIIWHWNLVVQQSSLIHHNRNQSNCVEFRRKLLFVARNANLIHAYYAAHNFGRGNFFALYKMEKQHFLLIGNTILNGKNCTHVKNGFVSFKVNCKPNHFIKRHT